MNIRTRALPEGWYPSSDREIRDLLALWQAKNSPVTASDSVLAGIVPHAGWEFCGSIIAETLKSLKKNIETIIILGGHNPPGGPFIEYSEDIWDLPSGKLYRDTELVMQMNKMLPDHFLLRKERSADNTVEVIIPLIAALFPGVKWAAWRLPADERSITFGKLLADAAEVTGRRIGVIGSTDLTHYGPNYGFTPPDSLESPDSWVEKRDRRILQALATFKGDRVLDLALSEKTACSPGAAVGAMAFAQKCGSQEGTIHRYATSRDIYPSSSFVGYGSITWESV